MPTSKQPDLDLGLDYWNKQDASLDGVLGGFGNGTLPRVDSLGSRQFLLSLMPDLCTVPSPLRKLNGSLPTRRTRALDVAAGIGRVTSSVLLNLTHDVVLVEPVEKFIRSALGSSSSWKGIDNKTKSVTFVQQTLQSFDPCLPIFVIPEKSVLGRVGYPLEQDGERGFDVVWCQWCLGHLPNKELVEFLKRAKASLRKAGDDFRFPGIIVVKENLCFDKEDGTPQTIFDDEDSSFTRSNAAWLNIFKEAGLSLLRDQVQLGLPAGLYEVRMYAVR